VACKVLVVAFEAACHSTVCCIPVNGRRKTQKKPPAPAQQLFGHAFRQGC